jgi:uncharacterized protein (DUF1501 family)
MLTFRARSARLCDGLSRRDVLHVGGLGALGLTLPALLGGRAQAAGKPLIRPSGGKAKSCILLFLMGGPPQHSTWDPKPDAPADVRGEIGPINTNVPGIQFGELMPRLATMADKLCVLRAVSTGDNAHSASGYYMLTGHPHVPMNQENANPGFPNDWPSLGGVVQQLAGGGRELPSSVRLPMHIFNTDGSVWPGQDAGFLGRPCDPWLFRCEPASKDFRIPQFSLPVDVTIDRLDGRRSLLGQLNGPLDNIQRSGALEHYSGLAQRAYDLLASPQSRAAFKLEDEPQALRERYGLTQFGQSTLLARRLVQAGVKLVQVNWFRGPDEPSDAPCWDSHASETKRLREVLIPPTDNAFSALLEDLSQCGMLDETLVVCMAEFGRTPKMNGRGGRDHWGPVFSIAMAGGGIRGGMVHGASDRLGGSPKDGLVRPEDITATIFHCLGYAPETEMHEPQGRGLAISKGEVVRGVLT